MSVLLKALRRASSPVVRHSSSQTCHRALPEQGRTAVFIPAANSAIGQAVISGALERNMEVFAFTGHREKAELLFPKHPSLHLISMTHEGYLDLDKVSQATRSALGGRVFEYSSVINTLGGTTSLVGFPDTREQLEQKNIQAPLGFVRGALQAIKGLTGN